MFIFQLLINGKWQDAHSGDRQMLLNPATEQVIASLPFGGQVDAVAAVDAAAAAFERWKKTTPYERAIILNKAADYILVHAESFAAITTEESGKPLSESLAEWRSAANYLYWNAEEAKRNYGRTIPARVANRRIQVLHQPLGVVASITAWNFPVYNLVRTWAAALAAGCTVIGRPSEYTPRSAMLLASALQAAELPVGVLNVVHGKAAEIGQVFLQDSRVRKLAFTGSTAVGKQLMAGAAHTVTRLALELGGNAPVLVFPDIADPQQFARQAFQWKMRNCGQVCVTPQRFYVHESILPAVTHTLLEVAQEQVLGNGLDPRTTIGPLINAKQRANIERLVHTSCQQGANLLAGGTRPAHLSHGYFYQPTVLADVQPGMPVYEEEIFGPIFPLIPFRDGAEALRLANQTEVGLAAFVFTSNLNTAIRVSEALEFGMVCVNDWLPATPEAPFGGVKQSGLGRECGAEGFLEYTETKTIFFGGLE